MITRRRDVAEKQVWDAGGEGKNVWDVGMPIIKTTGGRRQVKNVKKVKKSSGRQEAGGRVKLALGGGMQDKNEAGGGMLHPCVPLLNNIINEIDTYITFSILSSFGSAT